MQVEGSVLDSTMTSSSKRQKAVSSFQQFLAEICCRWLTNDGLFAAFDADRRRGRKAEHMQMNHLEISHEMPKSRNSGRNLAGLFFFKFR